MTGNKMNIREKCIIGDNVSIGTLAVVEHSVTIGDEVCIYSQAFTPKYCVLENGAWIGPNVVLTNTKSPLSPQAKSSLQPVYVKQRAIIGANSTILSGVTLGCSCIVSAGSVGVTDVEPCTVVAENPARFIRWKEELPYA